MEPQNDWYGYSVAMPNHPVEIQRNKISEWSKEFNRPINKIFNEKSANLQIGADLPARSTLKSMFDLLERGDNIVVFDFNLIYPDKHAIPNFLSDLKEAGITVWSACRNEDIFTYQEESELRHYKYVAQGLDAPLELDFTPTNICYGYTRVSTTMQVEQGISLQEQEYQIRRRAKEEGMVFAKIYTDEGKSGTTTEHRDGLKELLETIQPGQNLIAYSISRISRSMRDFMNILYDFTDKKVRVIIISNKIDTNESFFKLHMIFQSYMAEEEAKMIRSRVKDAMAAKKRNGEHVGRIPYGWQLRAGKGSGLIEKPDEQAVIARVKKLVDDEKMSYGGIATLFTEENVKLPERATKWVAATISRIYNRGEVNTKGRSNRYIENRESRSKN